MDRVLVLRSRGARPHKGFVRWLERNDRALRARFDFRAPAPWLPGRRHGLVLNWLQDPTDLRPFEARLARGVVRRAAARGVPVVNPGDALDRCRKSVQSRILRGVGIDTPPVGPVAGTPFPLVVRSDSVHAAPVWLCRSRADLEAVDLAAIRDPVAAPFVDVRGPDGFFRKWRVLLLGQRACPRHLQISREWLVRMASRNLAPAHVAEELAYTSGDDPHHAVLEVARRALGLDMVAFDYSLRPGGGVVVWEANPQPEIWVEALERPAYAYQRPLLERLFSLWRDDVAARLRGSGGVSAAGRPGAIEPLRESPPDPERDRRPGCSG